MAQKREKSTLRKLIDERGIKDLGSVKFYAQIRKQPFGE